METDFYDKLDPLLLQ